MCAQQFSLATRPAPAVAAATPPSQAGRLVFFWDPYFPCMYTTTQCIPAPLTRSTPGKKGNQLFRGGVIIKKMLASAGCLRGVQSTRKMANNGVIKTVAAGRGYFQLKLTEKRVFAVPLKSVQRLGSVTVVPFQNGGKNSRLRRNSYPDWEQKRLRCDWKSSLNYFALCVHLSCSGSSRLMRTAGNCSMS